MRTLTRHDRAHQIVNDLQRATYTHDYQVTYEDELALTHAVATIADMPNTVTTPDNIRKLAFQLARIASGNTNTPIIITGNCSELVTDPDNATIPTKEVLSEVKLVKDSRLRDNVLHIHRGRGQNTKPRSSEHEVLPGGESVHSYMGDAINSPLANERHANPQRLVDAAKQAVTLEQNLLAALHGTHLPAAHEALNLYYEQAFLRNDTDGKQYLLSADLPWIGVRTNNPHSLQVKLLAGVENPIGVKVGKDTSHNHLRALSDTLNPRHRLGKIAWMLRVGLDNLTELDQIVKNLAIIEESPLILYDIHGSTIHRSDGMKIRAVERISTEIDQLHSVCRKHRVRLNGLHLETTAKNRLECVTTVDQTPTHDGCVDPQLNAAQTQTIIDHFAKLCAQDN